MPEILALQKLKQGDFEVEASLGSKQMYKLTEQSLVSAKQIMHAFWKA